MAVFSTNQNNLFYVTKSSATADNSSVALGSLTLSSIKVGGVEDKEIYFHQKGNGGLVRSEIIPVDCITYAKATKASDCQIKLKLVTVALDSNVNEGAPIAGEDYVLRINFRQAYSMSDEDIYQKYGAVHALANMTAEQFYIRMIESLLKNFNHLYTPAVTIKAATAAGVDGTTTAATEVGSVKKSGSTYTAYDTTGSAISGIVGIVIEERPLTDEWALGTKNLQTVQFDVVPTEVFDDGDLVTWGVVTTADSATKIDNGYRVAEMEYFYMGERADQYRNIGWPNVIPTKYFADETGAYTMINIHFHYAGEGLLVHKSEKDITIAFATAALATAFITAFNALITDTSKLLNTIA